MEPGSKTDEPGAVMDTNIVELSELDWRVLSVLKRELTVEEISPAPWRPRAGEAGVSLDEFVRVAQSLNERKVIGRFSTFLEHVKPSAGGERVTRYNALFHWRVPEGREIEAGAKSGGTTSSPRVLARGRSRVRQRQHHGGGARHDKAVVLAHKEAIDRHLESVGIPVSYTNVFWGGRSEIKPSEISPVAYAEWCERVGLDPEAMRGASDVTAA